MSLVVAIKDQDRFIIGADKQVTYGASYQTSHTGTKVWLVNSYKGAVMAAVGDARTNQVIRYADIMVDRNRLPETGFDEKYVSDVIVSMIAENLKQAGIDTMVTDELGKDIMSFESQFLFAYGDKCWKIDPNGYVTEVNDFIAIGCAQDVAVGSLMENVGLDPFTRICHCIKNASLVNAAVDDAVEMVETEYRDGDDKLYNKAMGIIPERPKRKKRHIKKLRKE